MRKESPEEPTFHVASNIFWEELLLFQHLVPPLQILNILQVALIPVSIKDDLKYLLLKLLFQKQIFLWAFCFLKESHFTHKEEDTLYFLSLFLLLEWVESYRYQKLKKYVHWRYHAIKVETVCEANRWENQAAVPHCIHITNYSNLMAYSKISLIF